MTLPFLDEFFHATIEEEVGGGIFNAKGKLEKYSRNLPELLFSPSNTPMLEQYIPDLFPELIGYEQTLKSLQENREELYIDRVFRPTLYGKQGYVDLHVKSHRNGWVITVRDSTKYGMLEQKIIQQRNELDLLSSELAKERTKLDKLLRTFVPTAVVDDLLQKNTIKLGGEMRLVSILFGDLRGYTAWAEKREPEDAINGLNKSISEAVEILNANGATINQLMGDGFMSIYNAPIEQPDHASLALKSAREISNLSGLDENVRFGVGVNTGYAMVGNVGSKYAMDYSAIGTTTNIAYRIQGLAGPGEALFGKKTKELAGKEFPHIPLGSFKVKGIREPVTAYKIQP